MSADLRETARVLGIDGRTLTKLIERAGVKPKRDPNDGRRSLLDDKQIAQLRTTLAQSATRTGGSPVEARLDELEARVRALEARLVVVRAAASNIAPTRIAGQPARSSELPETDEELPAGTVALGGFAEAHGIASRTANDQARTGKYPITGIPSKQRVGHMVWFLTPERQRSAVAWWEMHSATFHRCPDCPHT